VASAAKDISQAGGLEQNIAPGHIFEAYRRLAAQGRVAGVRKLDRSEPSPLDVDSIMHEFQERQRALPAPVALMPDSTIPTTAASRQAPEDDSRLDDDLQMSNT
jgi:hypothetical protein